MVRRNRIVERFLTDFLGYDTAEAHEHAGASARGSRTTWLSGCTRSSGIPSAARTAGRSPPQQEREESRELVSLADLQRVTRARSSG